MSDAATKLASVLAYGEWHMVDGRDERGALEPQLAGLTRVGVSVVSTFVQGIFRGLQILTAIEEQPGLKLVPARTPQDFIVVDRVQRPSPD